MKYRIIERKNCIGEAFYTVQRKYLLWPFWLTYCYMIHPDLPDPPIEFNTEKYAQRFIDNHKASRFKVTRIIPSHSKGEKG